MKVKTGHGDSNAASHHPVGVEALLGSRILENVVDVVSIAGFLLFAFSILYEPQLIFPDAWFPSALAGLMFRLVVCAWILCEIANSLLSKKNSRATNQDKGSYWVIIIFLWVALFVAFVLRSLGLGVFGGVLQSLQYVGLILAVAGILLREWAILILGKHFTVRVQVHEKTALTTDGPYRHIRHPAYTGSLLTYTGIAWAVGSWSGVIFALIVCFAAYEYRIVVEEKALQDKFGTEYERYKKRTWKLFPGF
jgi:protein-S-isoprenylcysteine O-methyltransferase Ste14